MIKSGLCERDLVQELIKLQVSGNEMLKIDGLSRTNGTVTLAGGITVSFYPTTQWSLATAVMHRIADIMSYDDNPHGIALYAHNMDSSEYSDVEIQLTAIDLAFVTCAMLARYGLDNVRGMIDHIAEQDPTGQRVGLRTPARILETGRAHRS